MPRKTPRRAAGRKIKPTRRKHTVTKRVKVTPRRAPAKASQADVVDSLVTAGAQALKLPVDPAWYANVAFNLRLILRHAALVDEFVLPDDAEPAPVFYA
jgi:Protein of unknown function (DUF4089)